MNRVTPPKVKVGYGKVSGQEGGSKEALGKLGKWEVTQVDNNEIFFVAAGTDQKTNRNLTRNDLKKYLQGNYAMESRIELFIRDLSGQDPANIADVAERKAFSDTFCDWFLTTGSHEIATIVARRDIPAHIKNDPRFQECIKNLLDKGVKKEFICELLQSNALLEEMHKDGYSEMAEKLLIISLNKDHGQAIIKWLAERDSEFLEGFFKKSYNEIKSLFVGFPYFFAARLPKMDPAMSSKELLVIVDAMIPINAYHKPLTEGKKETLRRYYENNEQRVLEKEKDHLTQEVKEVVDMLIISEAKPLLEAMAKDPDSRWLYEFIKFSHRNRKKIAVNYQLVAYCLEKNPNEFSKLLMLLDDKELLDAFHGGQCDAIFKRLIERKDVLEIIKYWKDHRELFKSLIGTPEYRAMLEGVLTYEKEFEDVKGLFDKIRKNPLLLEQDPDPAVVRFLKEYNQPSLKSDDPTVKYAQDKPIRDLLDYMKKNLF